jgi:ribonuclease P protein component
MSQTLHKADRIYRRRDLDRVFRQGRSAVNGVLRLLVLANGSDQARMAVAVSSRHGPAVRRNRIKRLCREAFRVCRAALPPGYDYVLQPRPGQDPSLQSLRQSLLRLAGGLTREGRP